MDGRRKILNISSTERVLISKDILFKSIYESRLRSGQKKKKNRRGYNSKES
jgi:hypothetical protein